MRLSSLWFSPSPLNISFYFCVADILDARLHRGNVPITFYSESYLLAGRSTAEVQGAPAALARLFPCCHQGCSVMPTSYLRPGSASDHQIGQGRSKLGIPKFYARPRDGNASSNLVWAKRRHLQAHKSFALRLVFYVRVRLVGMK